MSRSKKPEKITPQSVGGEKRINRVLAAAGFGSRRQVEELIMQGRVEIDGQVCDNFGAKADPAVNKITVDGEALRRFRPVYFAVNKPSGVLCTNRDPQGRTRLVDLVPGNHRLFPIGRLDRSSTGLIILTNDGELSQKLTHPKYEVPKTYFVVVQGQVTSEDMQRMQRGVRLAEGFARVDSIKIRRVRRLSTEMEMTLTEGKNREIRRVLARLGHKVVVLRRIAIASLRLATLEEGAHRPLTSSEVQGLYVAAETAKRAKSKRKAAEEESGKVPGKVKPKSKPKVEPSADPGDFFDEDKMASSDVSDHAALVEVAPHWEDHETLAGFDPEGGVIDYESDGEPVSYDGEMIFNDFGDEDGEDEEDFEEAPISPRARPQGKPPRKSAGRGAPRSSGDRARPLPGKKSFRSKSSGPSRKGGPSKPSKGFKSKSSSASRPSKGFRSSKPTGARKGAGGRKGAGAGRPGKSFGKGRGKGR